MEAHRKLSYLAHREYSLKINHSIQVHLNKFEYHEKGQYFLSHFRKLNPYIIYIYCTE